ncbi:hypothetical protein EZV62_024463 [Acer yangbiense]|uniref:Uncharacterized protein n=1 Tax=Acer yangbiense TaxID=1000413 RepID=A0A5C7GV68_9ROSI|nr:hypothetical protein EZV62_024463 [Acer yangbiense]
MVTIIPGLDNAPKDGVVGFEELEAWNAQQVIDRLSYRTQKEMELSDKNGDGESKLEWGMVKLDGGKSNLSMQMLIIKNGSLISQLSGVL